MEDVPGVTRDRVSYDATWNGRAFTVVDTGGWDPDARGLAERIAAQAEIAVQIADAVLFVVDATVGRHRRRRGGRPDPAQVRQAGGPGREQGRRPAPGRPRSTRCGTSGWASRTRSRRIHGRGLRRPARRLPGGAARGARRSRSAAGRPAPGRDRRQAQRRQVLACSTSWRGRSGSSSTTPPAPPSTRSTSWSSWVAAPGASSTPRASASGSRRPPATSTTRSLRTHGAIERAEVCVMVVDASQSLSEQDQRIITQVAEAGRALVIAFNKWDLVDEERRYYLDREIERELVRVQWAPRINITAQHRLARRPARARARRRAGGLGDPGLHRAAQLLPGPPGLRAPAPGARRQAAEGPVRAPRPSTAPPTFVLFTSASSRTATSATSSAGCARSSASSARRSTSSSGRARSRSGRVAARQRSDSATVALR